MKQVRSIGLSPWKPMIDQFHTISKQNFIFFPTIIISSHTKKKNVLAQSNNIFFLKKDNWLWTQTHLRIALGSLTTSPSIVICSQKQKPVSNNYSMVHYIAKKRWKIHHFVVFCGGWTCPLCILCNQLFQYQYVNTIKK